MISFISVLHVVALSILVIAVMDWIIAKGAREEGMTQRYDMQNAKAVHVSTCANMVY